MVVVFSRTAARVSRRSFAIASVVAVACLVGGCSSASTPAVPIRTGATAIPVTGATSPTPAPSPKATSTASATPSAIPSPTATPAIAAGSMLDPAVANAALTDAQQFYGTLPHQNVTSDLQATAAHMVASKQFSSAQVTPGGISATLPNGAEAIVYADAPEDLPYPATGTSASAATQGARPQALPSGCNAADGLPAGGAVQHEIVFLANECDPNGIFNRNGNEYAFAGAFGANGLAKAGYEADVVNDTLDGIVALGTGHPIDYLSLATHGAVIVNRDFSMGYVNESAQAVDAASTATYNADIMASPPRVLYSLVLAYPNPAGLIAAKWSFTPAFLTERLKFNPGAIVYFHACYGASPAIVDLTAGQLSASGVNLYYGWTKTTQATDDDATEAFILDRLLGEQVDTGLGTLVPQRTPPQRPFPPADIDEALAKTTRPNSNSTYAQSDPSNPIENLGAPPTSSGSISELVVTPLAAIMSDQTPLLSSLPSIASMKMLAETPTSGTLAILGTFPIAQGVVTITDASGTSQLPVTTWSSTEVDVTLPSDGNGSSGMVQVFDATGNVGSNKVPLTQWTGTVNYNEADQIDALGGSDGTGPGAFGVTFALTFRGDVHPTVIGIESTPAPQNLFFPQVEGNSTAQVTTLHGNFTSSQGTPPPETATLTLNPVSVLMKPALPPLVANTFVVGAVPSQSSPCNNGTAGPEGDAGNVFCPGFGYMPTDAGICTDSDDTGTLCGGYSTFTPGGSLGEAGLVDPAPVLFTMDPSSYGISVSSSTTSFTRTFADGSPWPASASASGTFAVTNAPQAAEPAVRARRSSSDASARR